MPEAHSDFDYIIIKGVEKEFIRQNVMKAIRVQVLNEPIVK